MPESLMVRLSDSLKEVPGGVVLLTHTGMESPGPRVPIDILAAGELSENETPDGGVEGVGVDGATVLTGAPAVCLETDTEGPGTPTRESSTTSTRG